MCREREQLNRKYDPPPQSDAPNAFGVTRGGSSGRGARGRGRGRGGFGRGDGGPKREEVAIASGPFSMGSVITSKEPSMIINPLQALSGMTEPIAYRMLPQWAGNRRFR